MSELIQINQYYFDPTRVISVTDWASNKAAIHVDMNTWTATYVVDLEPDGWDMDAIIDAINSGRRLDAAV